MAEQKIQTSPVYMLGAEIENAFRAFEVATARHDLPSAVTWLSVAFAKAREERAINLSRCLEQSRYILDSLRTE